MEGKKISQLTPDISPTTDDFIVTVDGATSENKKVDLGNLPVSNPTTTYVDNRTPIYGTGFPNGVISATPGRIYIDENITNGASSWIKKSGTGNTGWVVLEGDTGVRDILHLVNTTYFSTTPAFNNYLNIQLKNGHVAIGGRLVATSDTPAAETQILNSLTAVDSAFRSSIAAGIFCPMVDTANLATPTIKLIRAYISATGSFGTTSLVAGGQYSFTAQYANNGNWPITLP